MRPAANGCGCFPSGRYYPGIAHLLRAPMVGVMSEFDVGSRWTELPIVMIDTETTGRDPRTDRIVEFAIVRGTAGNVVARDVWLIHPGRPIPAEATAVHGIRDEDVRDMPSFEAVCPEIQRALEHAIPAAYNVSFDRQFLVAEWQRAKLETTAFMTALASEAVWIDPLVWARHLLADVRSRKLSDVAVRLGIPIEQAHRATADAQAALMILYEFAKDSRVPVTYGALIQQQQALERAQEEARQMWRSR